NGWVGLEDRVRRRRSPQAEGGKVKSFILHVGRLLLSSLILFVVVITVLFFLLELAPGDPVQTLVGDVPISPEFRAKITAAYGLDLPAWQRYFAYLGNVFT